MSQDREPNSHLCAYFGRKLSNVVTNIQTIDNKGDYVVIGSDRDDEIYFDVIENKFVAPKPMLKERVTLTILSNFGNEMEIDLEDVLAFSAEYCEGIMIKVMQDRGLM